MIYHSIHSQRYNDMLSTQFCRKDDMLRCNRMGHRAMILQIVSLALVLDASCNGSGRFETNKIQTN